MDYHSSLPYQDSDQMRERDNSDHEDQEVNNRQSVIKFKDVGEEDDLEREVRKNVYTIFVFLSTVVWKDNLDLRIVQGIWLSLWSKAPIGQLEFNEN